MIYDVFNAIETRVKAATKFSGFGFFRFASEANANQQSNASVPFVKIAWREEQGQAKMNRWRLEDQLILDAEIRWKAADTDVNAITRIQEQDDHLEAFKIALFPKNEENFLNMQEILDIRITSKPLSFQGLEVKKHNGIEIEITIQYVDKI